MLTTRPDATTTYTTHLLSTLPSLLQSTTLRLSTAFSNAHTRSASHIASIEAATSHLTAPLTDAGLRITRDRGTAKEMTLEVTLGEQMGRFRSLVVREAENVQVLKERWREVQKGIEALGDNAGYAEALRKLEAEYAEKRRAVVERHGEECRRLVAEVRHSEKVYEKRQADYKRHIMMYMRAQMMDDDEEDEIEDGGDAFEEIE